MFPEMYCRQSLGKGYCMKLLQILRPGRDMPVWDVTRAVAARSFRKNSCPLGPGLKGRTVGHRHVSQD